MYVNQNSLDLGPNAPAWTVTGSSQLGAGASASILREKLDKSGVQTDPVPTGASLIAVTRPDDTGSLEFIGGDGDWSLNFVVARNGHVFSVQADTHKAGATCTTHVVVTPAG